MSYCLEDRLAAEGDAQLIVSDAPDDWTARLPNAKIVGPGLDGLGGETYDDIIVVHPTPPVVTTLAAKLNKNGNMFLLGAAAEPGYVTLDVGAVHYENKRFFGGGDTLEAVAEANRRIDLQPGGSALFIGAGGPMGQMHVQRALEKADGPARVVVTDLDPGRLDHMIRRFRPMADARGAELITLCAADFDSPDAMNARIGECAPDGYNDTVLLAPVPALLEQTIGFAAENAFVNVFAGLAIGTKAQIPLEVLCRGVKIIGCSGSRIRDLRTILELVESGQLDTNRSVAAIGGLDAAHAGLEAVKKAQFPGKTVIYTQLPELPLMPLEEVSARIPELEGTLSPEGAWTKEAEEALLEKYLAAQLRGWRGKG